MKTSLLFLACLLVVIGAKISITPCWRRVVKVAREDCKQECNTVNPNIECGSCIMNHGDCKLGFVEKCRQEFEDKSDREKCEVLSAALFYIRVIKQKPRDW